MKETRIPATAETDSVALPAARGRNVTGRHQASNGTATKSDQPSIPAGTTHCRWLRDAVHAYGSWPTPVDYHSSGPRMP